MEADTSSAMDMFLMWMPKICSRASWSGSPTSTIRSNLPGLSSASSRMSGLLVAPMILMLLVEVNPSSSERSCMRVLWTSRSPDVVTSSLLAPTESSSSMNMMLGAFSFASSNSSRTSLAPSPMYFWTSSDPTILMKVALVALATALAMRVFPVP